MRTVLDQVFSGRSVFVTGHTGFKGSWLSIWLHCLGAKVSGYALAPPTSPSNFEACAVRRLLAAHDEADLRDYARLHGALRAAAPDVVFHLAAQPIVRESYISPRETFDVNVKGTLFTVQKLLPLMPKGSAIVLNASMVSIKGLPAFSVYAATKAALRSFARSWIVDLRDRQIRVNVVSPGTIPSPAYDGLGLTREQMAGFIASQNAATPLGRVGSADEVAKAALFLASD